MDRILSQEVIDAIDLRFVECFQNGAIEFSRRGEVVAKGLFDDDTDPGVSIRRTRQARLFELGDHLGVNGGRRRQIVQAIALQVALLIEFFDPARELLERIRLVVIPGDVSKGLRESAKALLTCAATLAIPAHRLCHGILKSGIAHFAARETDNGKPPRQSGPQAANSKSAGISFRRVRSPDAPKITMVQGGSATWLPNSAARDYAGFGNVIGDGRHKIILLQRRV